MQKKQGMENTLWLMLLFVMTDMAMLSSMGQVVHRHVDRDVSIELKK